MERAQLNAGMIVFSGTYLHAAPHRVTSAAPHNKSGEHMKGGRYVTLQMYLGHDEYGHDKWGPVWVEKPSELMSRGSWLAVQARLRDEAIKASRDGRTAQEYRAVRGFFDSVGSPSAVELTMEKVAGPWIEALRETPSAWDPLAWWRGRDLLTQEVCVGFRVNRYKVRLGRLVEELGVIEADDDRKLASISW